MMDETMEKNWKNSRKECSFTLMSCSKDRPIHRRKRSGEFKKLKQTTMMNTIDVMTVIMCLFRDLLMILVSLKTEEKLSMKHLKKILFCLTPIIPKRYRDIYSGNQDTV